MDKIFPSEGNDASSILAGHTMTKKFIDILAQNKLDAKVIVFSESTRTALDAATTLKCELAQIAKSLIFKNADLEPVLVIASGVNRVDVAKVEKILNTSISKADADFVKEKTSYTIGGVPPFGFPSPITTLIDEDLMVLPLIWAAAGTPNSVFSLTPKDLVDITNAPVLSIKIDAV
jgi:prolyl-tRNA editing enzyme YbaK/EbsC (Cys-tRNA(Pro) deacylase)